MLELSSYQTELARALTPDVAVFTNLAADHLDRHGGMGGYFAAKRRLFAEGGPDRAVIGVDEPEGRFLANQLAEGLLDDRVIVVSAAGPRRRGRVGALRCAKGGFSWSAAAAGRLRPSTCAVFRVWPGLHNHQNACAAYGAARALGLGPREIEVGLASFRGLPHRSQPVAEIGGVRFVNDSKATNADAAAKALAAFGRIRWICGGLMKGGRARRARCRCSGGSRPPMSSGARRRPFALELGPGVPCEICTNHGRRSLRARRPTRNPARWFCWRRPAASFDQYGQFRTPGRGLHRLRGGACPALTRRGPALLPVRRRALPVGGARAVRRPGDARPRRAPRGEPAVLRLRRE